jgi:hypothetical protein
MTYINGKPFTLFGFLFAVFGLASCLLLVAGGWLWVFGVSVLSLGSLKAAFVSALTACVFGFLSDVTKA